MTMAVCLVDMNSLGHMGLRGGLTDDLVAISKDLSQDWVGIEILQSGMGSSTATRACIGCFSLAR